MTNQEAIIELKDLKDYCHSTFLKRTCEAYTQAINKAIETLENQSSVIEELEKIKTDIIKSCNNIAQEVSDLSYIRKIYVYEQLSEIKGVVDNHISELKGE